MKWQRIGLVGLLGVLMLLPGVGVSPAGAVGLSVADNGRRIDVRVGEDLILNLEATPSAGYGWRLADVDGNILRQTSAFQFERQSELAGAPEEQVLHFQALRPGATTVTLLYRRPWDRSDQALQTYTLKVDVLREWRY